MNGKDLKELCHATQEIAHSAADFIRSQVGKVADRHIESKERNSLVSYVDKQAEEILVSGLTPLVHDPGFITEEDTVQNTRSEFTWIIDPLDGTTNFLRQIPVFSVSVALAHHDEVILGCVIDIMQDSCYYAWRGGGAWLDGSAIGVSQTAQIQESLIATGFPYYQPEQLPNLLYALQKFLTNARGVRRLGSAALDMTYVACGKLDGFYETTLNPWDIAAGVILVREAGGVVTDFSGGGDFVTRKQILASNSLIHTDMLSLLMSHAPV